MAARASHRHGLRFWLWMWFWPLTDRPHIFHLRLLHVKDNDFPMLHLHGHAEHIISIIPKASSDRGHTKRRSIDTKQYRVHLHGTAHGVTRRSAFQGPVKGQSPYNEGDRVIRLHFQVSTGTKYPSSKV